MAESSSAARRNMELKRGVKDYKSILVPCGTVNTINQTKRIQIQSYLSFSLIIFIFPLYCILVYELQYYIYILYNTYSIHFVNL